MDKISVEGLKIDTIIGVHPREQAERQPVIIDVDVFTDIRGASSTDELGHTISYGDVARAITGLVEASRLNLIETLAENVADLVLKDFGAQRVVVKVGKPRAVKNASTVSVTIERVRT